MNISGTQNKNIQNFKKFFKISLYYKNKCKSSNLLIKDFKKSNIIYMITDFYCLDDNINEKTPFLVYQDIETGDIEKISNQEELLEITKFMKTKLYENVNEDLSNEDMVIEEKRVFNEDKLPKDVLDDRMKELMDQRNDI